MLPNSFNPNKLAAWFVELNWNELVWWIGTATEVWTSSFLKLPPCKPIVSEFKKFDMIISPFFEENIIIFYKNKKIYIILEYFLLF